CGAASPTRRSLRGDILSSYMPRFGSTYPQLGMAAGAAVLIALSAAACGNGPPDEKDYVKRINAERSAKDAEFQRLPAPVPGNRKAELLPLVYYPVDSS